MENPSLNNQKKKRHKSEFFAFAKPESRLTKPKRLSCMRASQFLQIEESQTEVANFLIEHILTKVYNSINQFMAISQNCTNQIEQQVNLLENYDMYTMIAMPEQFGFQICLQQEPKMQPNCKVIAKKQKLSENNQRKDLLTDDFNKMNSSNSKGKFFSKQKLLKVPNSLTVPNQSNKSLKSFKSSAGIMNSIGKYRISNKIQEEIEHQKQKDKKLKEETIKKLLKEHEVKLKQNPHPCPEPLLFQYRAFFTQPQTKEQENLRASFLQLKEFRASQEKHMNRKAYKKMSTQLMSQQISEKSITNSVHLPRIRNSELNSKEEKNISLFAQDDNGKIIKVKNNQQRETREYSITMHENYAKPRETALKELTNIYKTKVEHLKNQKIKNESTLLKENTSIVSSVCQSVDEQMLDRSIMENFPEKRGVLMKRSSFSQKSASYVELAGFRLPSLVRRR